MLSCPAKTRIASDASRGTAATEALLVSGGDARLRLDPGTGTNRYGCRPRPDPAVLDFASATASIISANGFAAADRLRRRFASGAERPALTARRIREELPELLGLGGMPGLETLLSPSGTDLHALALSAAWSGGSAQMSHRTSRGVTVLMAEPSETGSGVPAVLSGPPLRLAHPRRPGVELRTIAIRQRDGSPRTLDDVDDDFAAQAGAALAEDRDVLLVVLDVSKTGLTAPSSAMALALLKREPARLRLLVDACQARISRSSMRAWLEAGAMLALTGSKFLGGPSFSGALMLPADLAESCLFVSPPGSGLLLRWEAALAELRLFRSLPESGVRTLLRDFGWFMDERLAGQALIEALPGAGGQRGAPGVMDARDTQPSIFPLRFRDPGGTFLKPEAVSAVHRLLRQDLTGVLDGSVGGVPVHLGQPVHCGNPDGQTGAALRLCLSARQLVAAMERGTADTLMQQADLILKKLDLILRKLPKFA
ncbi:MAG: hypothetical protein PHU46_09305 [Rhodocyclaceae bacterium]|nr:hypothetical protein [Rhodocyclaceae bacterium]